MVKQFVNNVIDMGFINICLYAFVLLLIHQSIAFLLAHIEKMYGAKVQFYWYDIPITILFIFIFVYGIYIYEGK